MAEDKHGSVKILPHPFDIYSYLNFAITKAAFNIFAENLHAGRGAIDMKRIKQDFSLKAWVQSLGWT